MSLAQPRFKFGDKVRRRDGHFFAVTVIKHCSGGYYYNEETRIYDWIREEDLEPYQEPQKCSRGRTLQAKKKLYAYKLSNGGMIGFSEYEDNILHSARRPEYDIEFDSDKA